jgi:hypothetical protein
MGVALDMREWWVVQLFHHTNAGGFLLKSFRAARASVAVFYNISSLSHFNLKTREATHSINKNQGKDEKLILIRPRARGRCRRALEKIGRRLVSTPAATEKKENK